MKTIEMKNLLLTKCMKMKDSVESKSSNKNPNYYSTLKEYRLWLIIQELISTNKDDKEIVLSEESMEYITQHTNNKRCSVVVSEGDDLLSLLEKYKDVKDVYGKIMKSCAEQNLKIEGNKIVKC